MRVLHYLFVTLVVLMAVACTDDDPVNQVPTEPSDPSVPEGIILNKGNESITFDCVAGEKEISFKTSQSWKVEVPSASRDWLTATPISGEKGSSVITLSVKANKTYEERAAEVLLTSGADKKTITVTQVQKDALVIAKSSYTVAQGGDNISVEVGHNVDFDVKIDSDWIKQSKSRAYVTETLKFTVAKNSTFSKREGVITFVSKDGSIKQEVKVYQAPNDGLIVSKNEYVFNAKQHTFDIEIKANVDYRIEDPNVNWLHRIESRALTSRTVRYQVDANEDVEGRVAEIRIVSADGKLSEIVTVTQVQKDALVVAKNSYTVGQAGENIFIEVGHNVDFTVKIDVDWINKVTSRAYVKEHLQFAVAKNPETSNREGHIIFTSKNGKIQQVVKVYQSSRSGLIVSKHDHIFDSNQHEFDIEIKSNVEYKIEDPKVAWLHRLESRALTSRTVRYQVDANEDVEGRAAEIHIVSADGTMKETVTVSQMQKDALVVAKPSYTVVHSGGEITIEVGHNIDFTISIDSEWITQLTSRAYIKENIKFAVAKNMQVSERKGKITFTSKDKKIKQEVLVVQESKSDERKILVELYKVTNGAQWKDNTNWCSDKPLNEWYGIQTDADGYVTHLDLSNNNLSGKLPESIGDLSRMYWMMLSGNKLTGSIPSALGKLTQLQCLYLGGNQLSGEIPESMRKLINLNWLSLSSNQLSGKLPAWIGNFINLRWLFLNNNRFTGQIPVSFGNLCNLEYIHLSYNQLTGKIPQNIVSLSFWKTQWPQIVEHNKFDLTGTNLPAPKFTVNTINGKSLSDNLYSQNKITILFQFRKECPYSQEYLKTVLNVYEKCHSQGLEVLGISLDDNATTNQYVAEAKIPWDVFCYNDNRESYKFYMNGATPEIFVVDSSSNVVFTSMLENRDDLELFLSNYFDLKILVRPLNDKSFRKLVYDYQQYPSRWVFEGTKPAVVDFYATWCGYCQQMHPVMEQLAKEFEGKVDFYKVDIDREPNLFQLMAKGGGIPCFFFIPMKGNPTEARRAMDIQVMRQYINEMLGIKQYESVDYSKDGQMTTLQTATKGNGIDVVIMGDGYSDRQIASGEYAKDMQFAGEKFFTVEPYKTFKNYFNVHYVTTVSKNEGYFKNGETALSGWFGERTHVGGDDEKCIQYAKKVITSERMDDVVIVVVMNSNRHSGTCWMYSSMKNNDYGSGTSIAYFAKGQDQMEFEETLHHEAGGHGFAKLADEYAYPGVIPAKEIETYHQFEPRGWWKNVDFTNNPAQIKWAHFLSDSRYQNEVGIYEGGCTYAQGVWHPSQENIMVNNRGGFNAPSREAIYYRLHKLAFGDSWTYNYEDFVKYDAVNRNKTKSRVFRPRNFKPLHRPMVLNKTWQEASSDNRR